MRTFFELLRIVIIFIFYGAFGWLIIESFYKINEEVEAYSWLGLIAIFVLLFILYRNKWQFFGFYKGKDRKKLPRNVSLTLVFISIILMISPFVIGMLLD